MSQNNVSDKPEEGMENSKPQSVRLYQGPQDSMDYWKDLLGDATVPQLTSWVKQLKALYGECKVEVVSEYGDAVDAATVDKLLYSKKPLRKVDLIYFLSLLLSDYRNLQLYVDSLSEKQIQLWRKVLLNLYCSEKQLKGWNGNEEDDEDEYRTFDYNPVSYKVWLLCLNARTDEKPDKSRSWGYYSVYRNTTRYYFLPSSLRGLFVPVFFSMPEYLDSIPEESGMLVFNGENSLVQAFPTMQMLYTQDVLKVGRTKVSATLAKKVKGMLNLNEFFVHEGANEQLAQLRLNLTLPVISLMFEEFGGHKNTIVQDFLRRMEPYLCRCYARYLPLLLPHVKGIKKSWYASTSILHMVYIVLGELKCSKGKWVPMDRLVHFGVISPLVPNPLLLFHTYDLVNGEAVDNRRGEFIPLSKQVSVMGLPFLQGVVCILASLGLVEVAYRRELPDEGNPYPLVEYCRLTDLGKYALGLTDSYTPAVGGQVGELFKLDEQRLIVRSLVDNNPYECLLSETAVPMGNNRYMMSSASFFKTCTDKKDVAEKIDLYKRILGKDMPEHWKQFFDSLLRQCNPLKTVKGNAYVIYQIDPSNQELIELLSTDPQLKPLLIRAEGYRILVETDKVSVFKALLKKRGYLM